MRILYVNEHAAAVGGAERYIFDTAKGLAARGHVCHLLYEVTGRIEPTYVQPFAGAFPRVSLVEQVRDLAPDAIYIHRLDDRQAIAQLTASGVPVLRFHHDYDLLCPNRKKYYTSTGALCTHAMGARCWVPCLGVIARTSGGLTLQTPGHLRRLQQADQGRAVHVCGSEYTAGLLRETGYPATSIRVMPLFAQEPVAVAVERDPTRILFAGQLLRGKGLDILLRALATMTGAWQLDIAGSGRQEAWFRRLAAAPELNGRVTFLGSLPRAALDRAYAQAAVCVVPSRRPETFGLVGVEAFSHATPVVATDIGATREWLNDGVNGLLVPFADVAALAAALARLLGDPVLARRLGIAGQAAYRERFVPKVHLDLLERELLAGPR